MKRSFLRVERLDDRVQSVDPYAGTQLQNIVQGEFRVSSDPSVVFSTVLGSCVSACIYDPQAAVGGMNHFLLPESKDDRQKNIKYGSMAMELLINEMLKLGAQKQSMCAKLFGGARVATLASDVGERNIQFARDYMQRESVSIVSESLGGKDARRLQFKPTSGHARMSTVSAGQIVPAEPIAPKVDAPDITLF